MCKRSCMTSVYRAGDGAAGFGASFQGINRASLMPIIGGVIALLVIVLIVIVVLIVRLRRSTSSKAAAAAVVVGGVSSASPGTAASSALLAGQRTSCGSSSVTATPQQFDKRQLHQQYSELRDRPGVVVTHCARLTRPSPSPPAPHHQPPTSTTARPANVSSPFLTYSSMSNTALPVTAVSQPPQLHQRHYQLQQPQQAYQLQQQQLPHIQYYERC